MSRMIAITQTTKKRPLLISLMTISFWFSAGLTSLFALFLFFFQAFREQYTNSLGWFGWGILLSSLLTIYLITTGIGLWFIKKWGVLLSMPIPCSLVFIGFVSLVRFLISGIPTDGVSGLFIAIFFIVGGLDWISELWKFWQQANH